MAIIPRTCSHCGDLYQPVAMTQVTCSDRCHKRLKESRRRRRRDIEAGRILRPFKGKAEA